MEHCANGRNHASLSKLAKLQTRGWSPKSSKISIVKIARRTFSEAIGESEVRRHGTEALSDCTAVIHASQNIWRRRIHELPVGPRSKGIVDRAER